MKSHIALGSLVVLMAGAAMSAPPVDDASVRRQLEAMLSAGQLEQAAAFIDQALPDSRDKGYLYLRLAQTQYRRGQGRSSFISFRKALENAPPPPPAKAETLSPEIERQAQIASMFRTHNSLKVADRLLEALRRKAPENSTLLYETAYLRLNQQDPVAFYENYYQAYCRNRGSTWGQAGWAILRDYTDDDKIIPQECPWLAVAPQQYDNPKVWRNILLTLSGQDQAAVAASAAAVARKLPENLRGIFYCQFYAIADQKDKAAAAIAAVPPCADSDYRLDLFRRKLLLETGADAKALEGLGQPPADPYRRVLYYEFLTHYCQRTKMDAKGLATAAAFVDAVAAMAEPILADPQALSEVRNIVVRQLAGDQIENQDYLAAMQILATQQKTLDEANCDLIASLYLQSDKYANALLWMEYQLSKAAGEARADIVRRILDYSALDEKWDLFDRYMTFAAKAKVADVTAEYKDAPSRRGQGSFTRCWIPNIPSGYRVLWPDGWWRTAPLGPDALTAVWSLANFHGKKTSVADVAKGLAVPSDQRRQRLEVLAQFFRAQGLEVRFLVPRKDLAVALVRRNLPLILVGNVAEGGLGQDNFSILYGFDDRVGKFFCRESDEHGERRLAYEDIIDSRVLILVAPPQTMKVALTDDIASLAVASGEGKLTEQEQARLLGLGGATKYWALRRVGDERLTELDWPAAQKDYEQALALRSPQDLIFYENIASACVNQHASREALEYITKGLAVEPKSLRLLGAYIQAKDDLARESQKEGLPPEIAQDLLATAEKMQQINPDYPHGYFLKGHILARQKQWQAALTEFLKYNERYEATPPDYQLSQRPARQHALSAVRLFRIAILDEARK